MTDSGCKRSGNYLSSNLTCYNCSLRGDKEHLAQVKPTNYLPAPELQKFILSYGILDIPKGVNEPYFSPPIGLCGFINQSIISEGAVIAKIEGRDHFTHDAVASGQVTSPVYGYNIGPVKSLLVFFQPIGMYQLFGNDMSLLTNTSMPLKVFLGAEEASRLLSDLRSNLDAGHQIKVIDDFFLKQKPIEDEMTNQFLRGMDKIHDEKGNISITEILEYGHYHRKTLERHFTKMIGLSPKMYCKIYQFKSLMNLLESQPDITWIELANTAGYYDQSHMIRYVKEYLQVSPKDIVKLDMPFINYLLSR